MKTINAKPISIKAAAEKKIVLGFVNRCHRTGLVPIFVSESAICGPGIAYSKDRGFLCLGERGRGWKIAKREARFKIESDVEIFGPAVAFEPGFSRHFAKGSGRKSANL